MPLRVNNNILNQKGTPAFFSDTFANRPAFGFAGRVFISTDTGAIYEDTGSAWTLIADAGAGTTGTLQQVTTNGNSTTQGLVVTSGNVAIGTAIAGAPLDIHGTGTLAQFNGTGTNNAYIFFQNAGTNKWRVGNHYNTNQNSLDFYSFNAGGIAASFNGNGSLLLNFNLGIKNSTGFNQVSGYSNIATDSGGFFFNNGGANSAYLNFAGLTASRSFTFPDSNGTLATTANLSNYLPLSGGNLTGTLLATGVITAQTTSNGNITQNFLAYNSGTSVSGASYDFASGGTAQTARISANYEASLPDRMAMRFSVGQGSGLVELLRLYNSTMTVTGSATISGTVLIGSTTDTGQKLQVTGTTSDSSTFSFATKNSSGTVTLGIRNDGAITTGTAAASPYNLTVASTANLYVDNVGYLYRAISSIKYKRDIIDYDKGLNVLLNLRPVYYKGISNHDGNTQYAGLIAEEVHELGLTEFVQYAKDGTPDALSYSNMVSLLIKSIQELNEKLVRNNIN
jgi:hypothetical protein